MLVRLSFIFHPKLVLLCEPIFELVGRILLVDPSLVVSQVRGQQPIRVSKVFNDEWLRVVDEAGESDLEGVESTDERTDEECGWEWNAASSF